MLDDDERNLQQVWIYATPEFVAWFNTELSDLPTDDECELTPLEEAEQFMRILMLKKKASGQLTRLMPTRHGVWEVRSHHTRLFGWFLAPLTFVVCGGCPISNVKGANKIGYKHYFDKVINTRKSIGLPYAAGDLTHVLY